MFSITIRFYEELNFFLPVQKRKKDIEYSFKDRRSVKDLIESMGVPHVEVDLILVNGESVDFFYIVKDGDRISVYPVFETLSVKNVTRLRPEPLRNPRFVLDVHLRKLARGLRLLGFDVNYSSDRDDDVLALISEKEDRIILSRDRQLLMRKNISRGLYVRNTDPGEQLMEILDRLDLRDFCRPFTRCIECNGSVAAVEYESQQFNMLKDKIPEGVLKWCREFYTCQKCGNIYWKGSHYEKLVKKVEDILVEKE